METDVLTVLIVALAVIVGRVDSQHIQPEVTTHPVSAIVPLGSNSTFTCVVNNSALLIWQVNQAQLTSPEVEEALRQKGIFVVNSTHDQVGVHTSVLHVAAIERNNGTTLKCIATNDGFTSTDQSDVASIFVYGPPDSPCNATAAVLAPLSLNISWTAPYSIAPEVKVSYTVMAMNLNTSEQVSSGTLSHLFYRFEENVLSCDYYTFEVIAVNDAGSSLPCEVDEPVQLPNLPVISDSEVVQSMKIISGKISCKLTFVPADTCSSYPLTRFTVALHNAGSEALQSIVLDLIASVGDKSMTVTVNSTLGVKENANYTYMIWAHNDVGSAKYQSGIFYTTDVQDAEISIGSVSVQCKFAVGSEAKGCFVELKYNNTVYVVLNMSRDSGSSSVNISGAVPMPAHCYDIVVYDWEQDGTMGNLSIPVSEAVFNNSCRKPSQPPTGGSMEATVPMMVVIIGGVVTAVAAFFFILLLVLAVWKIKKPLSCYPIATDEDHPPEDACVELTDLKIKKSEGLGRGKIYTAVWSKKRYVVKKLCIPESMNADEMRSHCNKAISVLSELKRPNLVFTLAYTVDPSTNPTSLFLMMNLVKGRTLESFIFHGQLKDHPRKKLLIAKEVADAIHYLHGIPCTHQDIKPHNVIVSGLEFEVVSGQEVVSDLEVRIVEVGIADLRQKTDSTSGTSERYRAPEVKTDWNNIINLPADIYSLGCLFIELFGGKRLKSIASVNFTEIDISPTHRKMCQGCCETNPGDRPEISKVVEDLKKK